MFLTVQILVGLIFFARYSLACLVTGAPILRALAGPPLLSHGGDILARGTMPKDFGQETITTTVNGTKVTFIHHFGFKGEAVAGGNETIYISAPLFKLLSDVVNDKTICPHAAALRNSQSLNSKVSNSSTSKNPSLNTTHHSQAHTLRTRDDTDIAVIEQLRPGECTRPFLEWLLENWDPDELSLDIIPSPDHLQAASEFTNAEVEALYLYSNSLADSAGRAAPVAGYTSARQRWSGMKDLLIFIIALEMGLILAHQIGVVLLGNNLTKPPENPKCEENENAPACTDHDCYGEYDHCTRPAKKNCKCYPMMEWPLNSPEYDPVFFRKQQEAFRFWAPSKPEDGHLLCNGLGSVPYVTFEDGVTALKDFCKRDIYGKKNQRESKTYNQGKSNEVVLDIFFDKPFTILNHECEDFFHHMLTDCDGQEPLNPKDLKHGGKMTHPKGATFGLAPAKGANPRCNGADFKKWVPNSIGSDKILQFCKEESLRGERGNRPSRTFNKGKNTEVSLTAFWTEDSPMNFDHCVSSFKYMMNGCDWAHPIDNPYKHVYGGTYTQNGVVMVLTPNVDPPEFPPDAIAPDGKEIVPVCTEGARTFWSDLTKAVDEHCKDGHEFYQTKYDYLFGVARFRLRSASIDQDEVYKQGDPICRETKDWHPGKLRAQDCKDAFRIANEKCPRDGSFIYNCVEYSWDNQVFGQLDGGDLSRCGKPGTDGFITSGPCDPSAVVKLPPDAKNCNCNESGCTRESPDCCANGTCPGSYPDQKE